jgi:hypothetical protein
MDIRITIASLVVCVVSCFAQGSLEGPPVPDGEKVVVLVDTKQRPASLLDLIRMSSLIVDGTVTSHLPVINTSPVISTGAVAPGLQTHSVVAVNAVLSGAVPNSAANILLAEIGGQLGKWDISVEGDPLVAPGERYIFFLNSDEKKELPNFSGMPRYAPVGVWSGKIKVTNGKVAFAGPSNPQLHTYDGTGVDAFLQTLKQTISRPYTDADTHLPIHPPPPRKP